MSGKARRKQPPTASRIFDRRYGKSREYQQALKEEQQRLAIGELIRKWREKAGLTQAELAERAETSQSAVSRIESADYDRYNLQTLLKVANALEQPLTIKIGKIEASFVPA